VATAGYQRALANLATLDLLINEQKKQRQTVEAQFKAGAADQLEVSNAQIELFSGELLKYESRLKAMQALGQLEEAIQRPFEALAAIEQSPKPGDGKKHP